MAGRLCETYTAQHGYKCRLNIICRPRSSCSHHPNEHRQHFTPPASLYRRNSKHEKCFRTPCHVYRAQRLAFSCQNLLHQRKLLPPTVHKMLVLHRKHSGPHESHKITCREHTPWLKLFLFLVSALLCHTPFFVSFCPHFSHLNNTHYPPNSLKNCKQHDYLHEKPASNLYR